MGFSEKNQETLEFTILKINFNVGVFACDFLKKSSFTEIEFTSHTIIHSMCDFEKQKNNQVVINLKLAFMETVV